MPAELKQVSAKLVSFPSGSGSSGRPHVQRSRLCGKQKAVRGVEGFVYLCFHFLAEN